MRLIKICTIIKSNQNNFILDTFQPYFLPKILIAKSLFNFLPLYEVSKLLGHASVKTTEKHYAPLLVADIKDFVL